MSFVLGPVVIRRLTSRQIGQTVRQDGPESHLPKAGTPTMGGALILLAILSSTLLWADLGSRYIWTVILVTMAFGAAVFLFFQELFWTYLLGWQRVALGLLIVVIVVSFPQGIMGYARQRKPEWFGEIIEGDSR